MRLVLLAALAVSAPVAAQEVRLSALAHDMGWNSGAGGKEQGLALQGEWVSAPFSTLPAWTGRPRLSLMASAHSDGGTNYGGVSMVWRGPVGRRGFLEGVLGYVVHDGVTTLPRNPADPVRIRLDRTRIVFGSEDLFRLGVQIGVQMTPRWSVAVAYEHLSHGQILGDARNEGLDSIGLRVGYTYAD